MKTASNIFSHIDWLLLVLYTVLVVFGWINIYSVSYEPSFHQNIFHLSGSAAKQSLWIVTMLFLFLLSCLLEARFYQSLAYLFYAFAVLLLLGSLIWGVSVGGHRAWFPWGGQPSEFAKLACALAIARYVDEEDVQLSRLQPQLILLGLVLIPVGIILLQGDVGSSLVFGAFVIVFYREGLSPWFLVVGIFVITISILTLLMPHVYLIVGTVSLAFILIGAVRRTSKKVMLVLSITLGTLFLIEGSHLLVEKGLKPHQKSRIKVLVDPHIDPLGIGWNVTQSKIAIGSGGLFGKGFLQGSQTKYGFVPEQSTDFIFCTIGEEHGWAGAFLVIGVFLGLMSRILYIAERQRLRFARVYGYGVASVLFFHFATNIGMTIGLVPVIGIPLPFISYGGSSLCSFSLMLFILLKFDAERGNYCSWRQASCLHPMH